MKLKTILFAVLGNLLMGQALAAGGGGFPNENFVADIDNQESLQRGARYFMNYCAGCHSLDFQRYNRTFKDLGITPEIGAQNLIFTGVTDVQPMHSAMGKEEG